MLGLLQLKGALQQDSDTAASNAQLISAILNEMGASEFLQKIIENQDFTAEHHSTLSIAISQQVRYIFSITAPSPPPPS